MRAMLLAAGYGTRLKPLTIKRPKCLMPLLNTPLASFWLHRLAGWGAQGVVVNTHHLTEQVRGFLQDAMPDGPPLLESHEPKILGTGGGLVAAREDLGPAPFLLANADVAATAELPPLLQALEASDALAVWGVVDEPRFNSVAVDDQGRVLGFRGDQGLPSGARFLTYSGLAAISPALLDFLPSSGYSSLVDGVRAALRAGGLVLARPLQGFWDDLGTPERLLSLNLELARGQRPDLARLLPAGAGPIHPLARVSPEASLQGTCLLGPGASLAPGALLRDSLLLPGAGLGSGAQVLNAVLGDGFLARGRIQGGAHA